MDNQDLAQQLATLEEGDEVTFTTKGGETFETRLEEDAEVYIPEQLPQHDGFMYADRVLLIDPVEGINVDGTDKPYEALKFTCKERNDVWDNVRMEAYYYVNDRYKSDTIEVVDSSDESA